MADLRRHRVVNVDLADGVPDLGDARDDHDVYALLWWRDIPLGHEQVQSGTSPRELGHRVANRIATVVGDRLLDRGFERPLPGMPEPSAPELDAVRDIAEPLAGLDRAPHGHAGPAPTVTVAVCTRERPTDLQRCLAAIAAAETAPDEVIVVDNAADGDATRAVVARFPGVRYVREPRVGLSAARNAAVRAATGDLVAFTDDDAVVHPRWLAPLRDRFADPHVMAVTGLVLPAELETEAQVAFELSMGGLGKGYQRMAFGPEFLAHNRSSGPPVWMIGAGANMAVRREAFALVGAFDERLGAGAAGVAEDSELWYRLLGEGWTCRYEPASVVFHRHRRDMPALRGQMRAYARGHVAGLAIQFARYRHWGNLRRAVVGLPAWYTRRALREAGRPLAMRMGMADRRQPGTLRAEMRGFFEGVGYLRLALRAERPRHKAALGAFLARNPFPHPLTEGFFYREKMRAIHRVAPDLPFREVLEVGGGQSGLARMLYPHARVTTADLDPSYAASPLNQGDAVRFVTADATQLPFDDASFDAVTFFDVLEHIHDDRTAVDEALRVLRPGGFVLVTSPNDRWRFPYHGALRPFCPTDRAMIEEWGHVRRGYALRELESLFAAPAVKTATFITPVTALCHDVSWSRLPARLRRALCAGLAPLTWPAYALHPATGSGTETAASWRKPTS